MRYFKYKLNFNFSSHRNFQSENATFYIMPIHLIQFNKILTKLNYNDNLFYFIVIVRYFNYYIDF